MMGGRTLICTILALLLGGIASVEAQHRLDDLIQFGVKRLQDEANRQRPDARHQASSRESAVVAEIQRHLNGLGYSVGAVDGRVGGRTRQAIMDFQRDRGLTRTGEADERLLGALRIARSSSGGVSPRSAAAERPSFDCKNARQAVERAICALPELAALDRGLAEAYAAASTAGTTTLAEQTRWIARRNACGRDANCIAAAYQERLAELGAGGGALPVVSQDGVELTGALLADLIGPTVEPIPDRQTFDGAAAGYFRRHQVAVGKGDLPPDSPLPLDLLRGRQPEVIVALNRPRLRAALRENPPSLPLAIVLEQRVGASFDEDKGLLFNTRELAPSADEDPLTGLTLSSRDLPLYREQFRLDAWRAPSEAGFRESVIAALSPRVALELDRIVRLSPLPIDIESAAGRGLIGFSGERDVVVFRWDIDIMEVRAEKETVIVSAALRRLSLRWASDNAPVKEFSPDEFGTVAELRRAIEAALPPRASNDNVMTPPPGTRFGAEMADLLQLRFQPGTMDDRVLERMMISRFDYEAATPGQAPQWGSFFRELEKGLTQEERKARLGEFRAWSEARAAALPSSLTISLPLRDGSAGRTTPFERQGTHALAAQCTSATNDANGKASETQAVWARICAFLDAAWTAPEPMLFFSEDHNGTAGGGGLRSDCALDDPYCAGIYNAHASVQLAYGSVRNDVVHLDRLPQLDAGTDRREGRLAIEIEIEPTGVSVQGTWPDSIWNSARSKARSFGESNGVRVALPQTRVPGDPVTVFEAKVLSARLVDLDAGTVVTELPLVVPASLPDELLQPEETAVGGLDMLGIRLGMSFSEADSLIRGHMSVGKVLAANRGKQLSSASGDVVPYTSGRLYASAEGNELIAIFDEPPAAPDTVLGIWRILRLPPGETDPTALRVALTERYGEPGAVKEVSLPFMRKGLAFLWMDRAHERCDAIEFGFQNGLWQGDDGDQSWLPPFMSQPLFPLLGTAHDFLNAFGKVLEPAQLCPAFLGVRHATYDGSDFGQPAGDEIVTWLSDDRSYARLFEESRSMPAAARSSGEKTTPKIKF